MRIVNRINRRGREIFVCIRPFFKRSNLPDTKFIIFAQARTGSRLLGDLLNSHPEIHCDREIFLTRKPFFPEQYLEGLSARVEKKVYGFQLKLYQLHRYQKIDTEQFLFSLHKNGWKIIYLKRINILQQSVSNMIAANRQKYYDTSENPLKDSKFYIGCDELIRQMEEREMQLREERKLLEKLPHIILVYENDLLVAEKHQKSLDRIFDYLDIKSFPVETTLVRTCSNRVADFIENYDELVRVVSQTKHAKFLSYE